MRAARRAPEAVLAFVALIVLAITHGSPGPIGAAAAFVAAALCICVLPGYFIAGIVAPNAPAGWPERWMIAVGFSLFIIEVVCVVALLIHSPLHFAALGIAAALAVFAAVRLWRPAATATDLDGGDRNLRLIALVAWIVCGAVAYWAGNTGQADPSENFLNIGITDALRTAIGPHEAFYLYGVEPAYPFPGVNYAYGLVADLCGLSTVFVYEKMRLVWTLTALSTIFVAVRALSHKTSYAYLALLGGAVLALTGPFGPVPGLYWGQLATTSHPVDVAMNVVMPIALTALLLLLSSPKADHRRPALLFACLALLLSATHQRELVQLAVYAGCAIVVLRGRKPALMIGGAIIAAACATVAYRAWATAYAPGTGALLSATKAKLVSELHQMTIVGALRPLANHVLLYDFSFLYGVNGLMLVATAIVFLQRRDSVAIRTCGLAVAAFCASESFAILTIPVLWATYDELFWVPVRHIIFILYCCSSLAFAGMVGAITASVKPGRMGAAAGLAVLAAAALAAVSRILKAGFVPAEILVIGLGICGLAAFALRRENANRWESSAGEFFVVPALAALATFAALTVMPDASLLGAAVAKPAAFTPRQALRLEFDSYIRFQPGAQEGQCHAEATSLLGHRVDSQSCTPPFAVVAWLHDNVPRDGVLLLDPVGGFVSIGLLPVRIAAPSDFRPYRNWETAFPRVRRIIGCTLDRFGGMPFFAANETPEQRYADARALGATLVLADPAAHDLAVTAAQARPDLFRVLMDQSNWVLLALSDAGPASDSQPCPTP